MTVTHVQHTRDDISYIVTAGARPISGNAQTTRWCTVCSRRRCRKIARPQALTTRAGIPYGRRARARPHDAAFSPASDGEESLDDGRFSAAAGSSHVLFDLVRYVRGQQKLDKELGGLPFAGTSAAWRCAAASERAALRSARAGYHGASNCPLAPSTLIPRPHHPRHWRRWPSRP